MKICFVIQVLTLCLLSCHKGRHNAEACNTKFRRDVKELTDEQFSAINFVPDTTSVAELGKIKVPRVNHSTKRQVSELQLYTVYAKVAKVRREADGDYHILLEENGNYLIAENPNPGCKYAQSSTYLSVFNNVRAFIENNTLEGKMVFVTGIGFIDFNHHNGKKHAPNHFELHPIIAIGF